MANSSIDPALAERLLARLDALEAKLDRALLERPDKEWYTVNEAAAALGRAPFTVRNNLRTGRMRGEKRGRGPTADWIVPRIELERVRREGLLPLRR